MDRLSARAEEASLNAWPALKEIFYDGWLIRLAGGETRRTNSVNVIGDARGTLDDKIPHCEAIYRAHGLPAYFRLRSNDSSGLDAQLDALGFRAEDSTRTLFCDLSEIAAAKPDPRVRLHGERPPQAWLAAHARFTGRDRKACQVRAQLLELIAVPAAFAALHDGDGAILSVAYGALHDGLLSLQWVATDPARRGEGLAASVIERLFVWARAQGADGACLQVVADNAPALRLYARLGFGRELYSYHYRVR